MKRTPHIAAVVVCCLLAVLARAAEVIPLTEGGQLGATLVGISWPESLPTDLKSGIENKVLVRFTLLAGAQLVRQVDATVFIKYELWDEVFRVRTTVGAETRMQLELKSASDVLGHLSRLEFARLIPLDALSQYGPLTMRGEVLVNPVEREKIERLRKWVAANSAPNGIVQSATLTSKPNDLFNRIFEQYVAGDEISAPWKTTLMSKAFNPKVGGAGGE